MYLIIPFVLGSNKDVKWVSEVFRRNKWKDGSKLFDLEKDDGFRLLVPQRDFRIGGENSQQIGDGMENSRKIIFIISRYFLFLGNLSLCLHLWLCVSHFQSFLSFPMFGRNFLRSKRKLWYFKAADAEALTKKKIVVVFKEKLKMKELIPELRTYMKLRLCIQPENDINKMVARIRYVQLHNAQLLVGIYVYCTCHTLFCCT